MSEKVRSRSCRPWITLTTFVAMLCVASLVFATPPVRNVLNNKKMVTGEPGAPGDALPPTGNTNLAAVPANDTCAGAIELSLGIVQKVDSVGATNDYQTPATAACYQGLPGTQVFSTAPGRDVVFKFTAPAADNYTVRLVVDAVTNDFRNQNGVLYLVDGGSGCFGAGTVSCLKGSNRLQSRAFHSSVGSTDNHGESVDCVPLAAGQTVYAVFDDHKAGNAGSNPKIEVLRCDSEAEPNDTPGTANPYVCDLQGASHVAPTAHCQLGTKAGQACTRSGVLDVSFVGETDADCDPRCIGGPNTGLACITNGQCNPVTDVGAICAGVCVIDSVCTGGANDGLACTATCSAGPRVGQFCAISTNAISLISNAINGTGIFVNPLITITGCGTGFACVQNNSCPGGACSIRNNEGDADFYSLGVVPAGSKIFAGIDGNEANDCDFRMRVTTSTDTLQWDDDDGNFTTGGRVPVIAGAVGTGVETFLKVSRTVPRQAEPYHLNAIVRGPLASAQLESEVNADGITNTIYYYWPGNTVAAEAITGGGYLRGNFAALEADCFKFCVNKGDLMHWYGDGNPNRTSPPTLSQLVQPIIYDSDGAGISNFIFGSEQRKNVGPFTPSAGLNGLTPATTSSYTDYRATYTGQIEVCFYEPSSRVTPTPRPGYAPGPWAASLGVNCGPVDDCTTNPCDLTATKTGPAGPVQAGDIVTYTIAATNNGPGICADVKFQDFLDPNVVFVSMSIEDGFDSDDDGAEGDNTHCPLTPTPGQNDAFIDCINVSMAPGTTTTYTLKVQVNNCIGPDVPIFNSAVLATRTPDPTTTTCDILNIFTGQFDTVPCENPSWEFVTTDDGCSDLACDEESCTYNLCTVGDTCVDGVCNPGGEPGPVCANGTYSCDDCSVCTEDSCSPAVGCVNDSSQLGDLCDNAGACLCLEDYCDPELFCLTRPVNCDDGNACTNDSCATPGDCASGCVYTPVVCDDGNACTDDSCDPASGCVTAPHSCDDGECCTNDLCDPSTGCYHTPNTTPPALTPTTLPACLILWPPQHGYVDISLLSTGITASHQCGIVSTGFASCDSSQEENAHGTGDGNSIRDCVYTADLLSLRAERNGACSPLGRVYTSHVAATDACGNTAVSPTFEVGVWHDRGHGPHGLYLSANPGSNQNDQRPLATGGTYGPDCGQGLNPACDATGQVHDSSDEDPEAEISQEAAISVGDLKLNKSGVNVVLSWTTPGAPGQVTRFHVWRLDPVTLFWTHMAELTKQTTSYQDPVMGDGLVHQYKVSAIIKP